MPRLTAVMLIITLSSIGLPGMNGFIGEFLIMLGAFKWDSRFVVVAALGVILSAVYMLWMFQRVFYGKVTNATTKTCPTCRSANGRLSARWPRPPSAWACAPNVFSKPMEPAIAAPRRSRPVAPAADRGIRGRGFCRAVDQTGVQSADPAGVEARSARPQDPRSSGPVVSRGVRR